MPPTLFVNNPATRATVFKLESGWISTDVTGPGMHRRVVSVRVPLVVTLRALPELCERD